jgi:serine/threonine-protein phosphatase PGAM5
VHLYLVRHGEADGDGADSALTDVGRRQASLLGARLAGVHFAAVRHSPLTRAAQTARVLGEHLPRVPLVADEMVGDYVPFVPPHLPPVWDTYFEGFSPDELAQGASAATAAIARHTHPHAAPELIVTHSFLIAWFVRHALDAPPARWLGLNSGNCGLTVIRYVEGRPPSLVLFNDMGHLPPDMQWTGFPPHLRP